MTDEPSEMETVEELEEHFGVSDRQPDMTVEHPKTIELSGALTLLVIAHNSLDYYDVYIVSEDEGGVYEPRRAFGGR